MNNIQEKILELLLEIDKICRRNNISYFLNEHLALGAKRSGSFLPDCCSASLLMTDSDSKKFISAFSKSRKFHVSRSIEYLGNNSDFGSFNIKYVNKNSLYFTAREWDQSNQHGICVYIHTLAFLPVDEKIRKKYLENENLLRKYLSGSKDSILDKDKLPEIYNIATSSHLPENYSKDDKYYVRTPKYISDLKFKPRTFPVSMFFKENTDSIDLEGFKFPIVKDIEGFLTVCYGKNWRTKSVSGQVPGNTIVADESIPYKKYFKKLERYIDRDEFISALSRHIENEGNIQNVFKSISSYYDIVKNVHTEITVGRSDEPVSELQKRLLILLKEFDAICKKHNITYYADSGTALGAVRHNGFIPWDDDADLMMTRDNWDKFLSIIDDELGPDRDLVCFERNTDYHSSVCRYVDKSTARITYSMCLSEFAAGHCIDIFVLDPISDLIEEQNNYIKNMLAYMEFRCPNFIINENFDKELYEKYLSRAETYQNFDTADEIFRHEIFDKYLGKNTSHCIRRWNTRVYVHENTSFGDPVYFDFEDMKLPLPSEYKRLFVEWYGNTWNVVPDKSEQLTHGSVYCSNLDVSYIEYRKKYMPLFNGEEISDLDFRQKLIDRKRLQVEGNKDAIFYKRSLYFMQGLRIAMALDKAYRRAKVKPEKLLKEERYDELNDFFKEYFKVQCSRTYWGDNIFIPLSSRLLYIASTTLAVKGNYFHAGKILSNTLVSLSGSLSSTSQSLPVLPKSGFHISNFFTRFSSNKMKKLQQIIDENIFK